MKIRLAKKKDIPQVAKMYIASFNKVATEERWTNKMALALCSYWFKRQPDLFYVAEEKGKVVGCVMVNIKPWWDGNRFQDGELFISPKQQRRGIGKKLFITALEKARKKYKANAFEGITFNRNEFPLTWYRKLGLKEDKNLVVVTGDCKKILKKLKENN